LLVLALASTGAAAAEKLLLGFDYLLEANKPYRTDLYRVDGAPAQVTELKLLQVGTYCDIAVDYVEFNVTRNGPVSRARHISGGRYAVPNGVLNAVNVAFTQRTYSNVSCRLEIWGLTGGDTDPTDPTDPNPGDRVLLGAVRYEGGFRNDLSLPVTGQDRLSHLWLEVPAFCTGVEILGAGTVVAGIYFEADLAGSRPNVFRVDPAGSGGVTQVRLALNGPRTASCDIPVYASRFLARSAPETVLSVAKDLAESAP